VKSCVCTVELTRYAARVFSSDMKVEHRRPWHHVTILLVTDSYVFPDRHYRSAFHNKLVDRAGMEELPIRCSTTVQFIPPPDQTTWVRLLHFFQTSLVCRGQLKSWRIFRR
jgi:hypothetical protein